MRGVQLPYARRERVRRLPKVKGRGKPQAEGAKSEK